MNAPMWIISVIDIIGSTTAIVLSFYAVLYMRRIYMQRREHTLATFLYLQTLALAIFAISRSAGHILKHILVALDAKQIWTVIAPVSGSINSFTFIIFGLSALLYANVRDISARVKDLESRKAALQESEERYRTLIESSPDMIHLIGTDGRILSVNSVEAETLGYDKEDLLSMKVCQLIPEDKYEEFQEMRQNIIETGRARFETEFVRKNSTRLPVEINSLTIHSSADEEITTICIIRDITERKKAEDLIRKALEEKEVLLKEIHHRVKNNMQIISSLLNLQSLNIQDKESLKAFSESSARIRAMAIAHECLYKHQDISNVNAAEYIRSLAENIIRSFDSMKKNIELKLDLEEVPLNIDNLIPCGLIINELVTNCLKYAFKEGHEAPEISISLMQVGDDIWLTVKDNGQGLPNGMDFANTNTLGLQLVISLVRQIEGDIKLENAGGAGFTVIFPMEE